MSDQIQGLARKLVENPNDLEALNALARLAARKGITKGGKMVTLHGNCSVIRIPRDEIRRVAVDYEGNVVVIDHGGYDMVLSQHNTLTGGDLFERTWRSAFFKTVSECLFSNMDDEIDIDSVVKDIVRRIPVR